MWATTINSLTKEELDERSFYSLCSVMFMRRCIECKVFIEFGATYSVYLGRGHFGGWDVNYTCQDCMTARDVLLDVEILTSFVFGTLGHRLYSIQGGYFREYAFRRTSADPDYLPPVDIRAQLTTMTKDVTKVSASLGLTMAEASREVRRRRS